MSSSKTSTIELFSTSVADGITARRAAAMLPSGVAIFTNGHVSLTVSTLQLFSEMPLMICFAIEKSSIPGMSLLAGGNLEVRILRDDERGLAHDPYMAPRAPALARMICSLTRCLDTGDHILAVAAVNEASSDFGYPLVYWRRGLHSVQPKYDFMESEDIFDNFLRQWSSGALPRSSWTHAAHIAVCTQFAHSSSIEGYAKLKRGILRYNQSVGIADTTTSGFHETLTRFWFEIVCHSINTVEDRWTNVKAMVHRFGEDRDLHRYYYSFDLIRSMEARARWLEPDLRRLDNAQESFFERRHGLPTREI